MIGSIDVIIPARGEVRWLKKALQSIAAQDRRADGVLLIDDGICDADAARVLGHTLFGARFQLLRAQGQGISNALNTGVSYSRAAWIARMDADDVAHPQRLSRQWDFLAQMSDEVAGCGTQVRLIDERGRRLGLSQYPTGQERLRNESLVRSCFAHPSMMLRRDVLLDVPYRSALDGAEDVDLFLRIMQRHRLVNLDEALLDYRIYTEQTNFAGRARQAALQELGFRLADIRGAAGKDPLDAEPDLAQRFVEWRLAQEGYADARNAMTAVRYMRAFLQSGNLVASARCGMSLLKAKPWRPSVYRWIDRVRRDGPGCLRHDPVPLSGLQFAPADRPTPGKLPRA